MKQWSRAFETWKDFCPYIKRELYSKKDFVKWAKGLGFVPTFQEDDFFVFLTFLEEAEILCPLTIGHRSVKKAIGGTYWKYVPQEKRVALYHPIQFLEVILWLNFAHSKKSPYFYHEMFKEYFYLRKMQYKLIDYHKTIKNYKKMDFDTKFTEDPSRNYEENLIKRMREGKTDYPRGGKLLREIIFGWVRPILTEEYLMSWVKLESLNPDDAKISGPNYPDMRLNITSRENDIVEQCINNYRAWREDSVLLMNLLISEENRLNIRRFHSELGTKIGDGPFGSFGTKGNWMDLFDLIPSYKKNKLGGLVSIYINLLDIRRFIDRSYWELFNKNIVHDRETDEKPYFIYDGREDYQEYVKSVLLDFDLFSSNPFILYVEGESESVIIQEYVNRKPFIRFKIRNIRGITNAPFYMKISEDSEEHEYFFFFDFDSKKEYLERKAEYEGYCDFFFPDFMTENFTVDQFNDVFLSWADEIGFNLSDVDKDNIRSLFDEEKRGSNGILNEIETGEELTERNPKGFEKVLINYLSMNCKGELQRIFPDDIKLGPRGFLKKESKKFFSDIIKKEISNRLSLLIIDSMTSDPERRNSEKFKFEEKINPFMNRLLDIVNRTPMHSG